MFCCLVTSKVKQGKNIIYQRKKINLLKVYRSYKSTYLHYSFNEIKCMSCTSLFTWPTAPWILVLCIESTFSVSSRHSKTKAPLHCKYVCQASIQKVSKLMCSSFSSETFQTYWQQKQIFTYKGRPLVGTAIPAPLHEEN